MQKKATVVGAGVAGLTAALLLRRAGCEVEVFEGDSRAGGMLAPVVHDGIGCDRGSHRVHPEAHPLLLELTTEAGWQKRPRAGRLILGGRHLSYPLNPLRFLSGLGIRTSLTMASDWLRRPSMVSRWLNWERDRPSAVDDEGFEAFVTERVGRAAYKQFYDPYARKVWGIDPGELSRTVAKQRVSSSNPLKSILSRGRQSYLYPRKGMASLVRLLRRKSEAAGARFHFGERYHHSVMNDGGGVFFTGHLDDLVPDCTLSHRGLYLVYLSVAPEVLGETDTWYAPETRFWFGRVSQPAQFSTELCPDGRRVVCVEIPEGRWGRERDFLLEVETLVQQLVDAGIFTRKVKPSVMSQTFLPRVYPMYRRGWVQEQRRVLRRVAELGNVFPCGRQGLFLHCNMDHAVRTAEAAVNHWLGGGDSSNWSDRCEEFLDVQVRD